MRDSIRVYGQARGATPEDMIQSCLALRDAVLYCVGHINPFLDDARLPNGVNFARSMDSGACLAFAIREAVGLDVDLCIDVHRPLDPAQAVVSAMPSGTSVRCSTRIRSDPTASTRWPASRPMCRCRRTRATAHPPAVGWCYPERHLCRIL